MIFKNPSLFTFTEPPNSNLFLKIILTKSEKSAASKKSSIYAYSSIKKTKVNVQQKEIMVLQASLSKLKNSLKVQTAIN